VIVAVVGGGQSEDDLVPILVVVPVGDIEVVEGPQETGEGTAHHDLEAGPERDQDARVQNTITFRTTSTLMIEGGIPRFQKA